MALTPEQLSALVSGVQTAAQAGSAWANYRAAESQAGFVREAGLINSRMTELQAADVVARAEEDARKLKSRGRQLKGSQRAALAANGVEVDSGSAADIQADTDLQVELDADTITNNAWREAWGLKAQSDINSAQTKMNARAIENAGRAGLISGGLQAVGGGLQTYGHYRSGKRDKRYDPPIVRP